MTLLCTAENTLLKSDRRSLFFNIEVHLKIVDLKSSVHFLKTLECEVCCSNWVRYQSLPSEAPWSWPASQKEQVYGESGNWELCFEIELPFQLRQKYYKACKTLPTSFIITASFSYLWGSLSRLVIDFLCFGICESRQLKKEFLSILKYQSKMESSFKC